MNALERLKSQQDLAVQVIEKLCIKTVFVIKFTDYELSLQADFDELAQVEGAEPYKGFEGFYIRMKVDSVEISAHRSFTEEEMLAEEQKKDASA